MLDALQWVRNYNATKAKFYDEGIGLHKEIEVIDEDFRQFFYTEFYDKLYKEGLENVEHGYHYRCDGGGDGDYYDFLFYSFKELKNIKDILNELKGNDAVIDDLLQLVNDFPNALKERSPFINPKNIDRAYDKVFNEAANNVIVVKTNDVNDSLESTIDKYLMDFVENEAITNENYANLKSLLCNYFKNGECPKLPNEIIIMPRNKKNLAFALGKIYRSAGKPKFEYAFFELIRNNIAVFKDEKFTEENYTKSNLIKYLTTKPPKKPIANSKYQSTHSLPAANDFDE